jgi:hypothetical protein
MIGLHYAPTPRARPQVQAGLAIGKFEGAVRRGSAKEYVRAGREGAGGTKIIVRQTQMCFLMVRRRLLRRLEP